jgi:hypothetical protein
MGFQASGGTSDEGIKTCSFTARVDDTWTSRCESAEPDDDSVDAFITSGKLRTGTLEFVGAGSTCPVCAGSSCPGITGPGALD